MKFTDLRLSEPILAAVAGEGYEVATPIQAQTIPHTLAGRDVLGCAQTGTGKTAAFALPILNRFAAEGRPKGRRMPRALVLAPTRELAQQIAESFATYGRQVDVYGTVLFGGVGQGPQVQALRRGVDVVVATPGRLLDLVNQGHCDLSAVSVFVLDEADRMLDMGFMPDIRRIISHLPDRKQTLLFSATMPDEIRDLADGLLHRPAEVTVSAESPAVERIEQAVYHVDRPNKSALLAHLVSSCSISRAIVFTRTKHGADRVARQLKRSGISADAIHGDKAQGARRRALDRFREGQVHILVATDIAARGIDVDGISHVFNYDMCRDAESHIHRIGRTARAGAAGTAISFCDREELPFLRSIERLIRMKIEVIGDHPTYAQRPPTDRAAHPLQRGDKSRQRRRQGSGNQGGASESRVGRSRNGNVAGKNRNKKTRSQGGSGTAGNGRRGSTAPKNGKTARRSTSRRP